MKSLYQRYIQGDHEGIWEDLMLLGPHAREPKYREDVYAVARETMLRAQHNIEILVEHLPNVGYKFGIFPSTFSISIEDTLICEGVPAQYHTAWKEYNRLVQAGHRHLSWEYGKPALFRPAQSDASQLVEKLQQLIQGPLPFSLQAWFETIQEVNFCGTQPSSWVKLNPSVDMGEPHVELDPLYVVGIQQILEQKRFLITDHGMVIYLAPEDMFKREIADSGGYAVLLPDSSADFLFHHEWHRTTFVNYLRLCFRWAGLPGLVYQSIPKETLKYLTCDLLPL